MRYRRLGNTDLQVSVLGLGTMMFGSWGNPDLQACSRIVDTAIDAGINLIDTADIYDDGRSEEILGKCLAGRRDQVILATKWIDVYQMHRPDPDTPIEETLGALDELVQSGKIRAVGTSTFPSEGLEEAQWTAQRAGYTPPSSEQPPYSLLARHVERDVLPTCQRLGIGVVTWAPLNGGWLTGKYSGSTPPRGSRAEREPEHFDFESPYHQRKASAVAGLKTIAQEGGLTLPHLSLSFVLEHPAVTSALLGPRTVEQLGDLLGAENISLTTEALAQIDDLVKPGETINMHDAGQAPPELPLFP
jgi:aryl-alcohol dehydrogenase-like predicted oxidoreductase